MKASRKRHDHGVQRHPITVSATGKLRRYFDLKNFTDPFRIIKGYFEARSRLKKIHPDVVFSKGGFVAVPVVRAAHALKMSCDHSRIRHDTRPGQQTLYPCCLQGLLQFSGDA